MTLVLVPVEGQTIAHRKKANLSKELTNLKQKTIRLFTENVYNKRDKNDFAPYIKLGLENRICLIVL